MADVGAWFPSGIYKPMFDVRCGEYCVKDLCFYCWNAFALNGISFPLKMTAWKLEVRWYVQVQIQHITIKCWWHLDKFLLVLSYLKELLIALVFRTIDLVRLPVMSSKRQLYSESFRKLLQFLRKARVTWKISKQKSLLQNVGFQKNTNCSADGDSDPSRCAKTSRVAGSQDAFGNRKRTGQHIWKSWILMIGFC